MDSTKRLDPADPQYRSAPMASDLTGMPVAARPDAHLAVTHEDPAKAGSKARREVSFLHDQNNRAVDRFASVSRTICGPRDRYPELIRGKA